MTRVESFAPIARLDAAVLILGSMPSVASLAAAQYYAHPRNAFWRIMGELFEAGPELLYAKRARQLRSHRIAVWDVLAGCEREGSLDAAIDDATSEPNDFRTFYRKHPKIRRVLFNGAKSEQAYRRFVLPGLEGDARDYARLPSTSPANASISYARKLEAWRRALAQP